MSNQSGVHDAVRTQIMQRYSYGEDWSALFDAAGIPRGDWNGRLCNWIDSRLGTNYAQAGGITAAMHAFAVSQGFNNWASMNTITFTPAWVLTSGTSTAALDLDFVNDRAWLGSTTSSVAALLACSNATTTRYYTKADGTLISFAANTLRYGTAGLLIEEARTNFALQSQAVTTTPWSTAFVTVALNATTAPDGTSTAASLTCNHTGSLAQIADQLITGTNATYTYSGYVKQGTTTWAWLDANDGANVSHVTYFNLATGVVGTNAAGNTATITALANGWYRIAVSRAYGAGINGYWTTGVCDADASQNCTSGQSMYFWGAQFELGAFASSYIPTTTVAVTRAADIITFSDLTWFDGASETLFAKWTATGRAGTLWAIDATNDVTLSETATGAAKILDAGTTFAITTGNTATAGTSAKTAARMATNDIALCLNGGTVGTDTSATQPGTISAARLGVDLSGANALNGYILEVAAFKSLLVNSAGLQTLTT